MTRWYDALLERQAIRSAKAQKKEGRIKNTRSAGASDGRVLSSGLEKDVYEELLLQQRGNLISDLKCQVQVHLTRARILYKPDFCYTTNHGVTEYAEAKGFETETWRIKRRLWKHYGPGKLNVYKRGPRQSVLITETIDPRTATSDDE